MHLVSMISQFSLKSNSIRSNANLVFDLIFVTSAPTDDEGRALLKALGMPFREPKKADDAA